MIFLQHLFISCRTGAFRHLNFIESVYNLQAGDHLVRKVRTRRGKLKRTYAPSQTKKSRCLLGRVRRGWSGATSERHIWSHAQGHKKEEELRASKERKGSDRLPFCPQLLAAFHDSPTTRSNQARKGGLEGRKKKRRSVAVPPCCRPWSPTCCSPTPRYLPPLNDHQIKAGDWGEWAEEPNRRREGRRGRREIGGDARSTTFLQRWRQPAVLPRLQPQETELWILSNDPLLILSSLASLIVFVPAALLRPQHLQPRRQLWISFLLL